MRFKCVDPGEWRLWFAWYPVRIGDEMVWLERVAARTVVHDYGWDFYVETQYAHAKDVLGNSK